MGGYLTTTLTPETWDAFADLCSRNNGGGMGGCWCCWFHNSTSVEKRAAGGDDWRGYNQGLVIEGQAHAALVFEGDTAMGWCEYGTPTELPGIFHRKMAEAGSQLPDYRLTCFFVDRGHRGQGVATAALDGALELIAQSGGGVVETYPRDIAGKKYSASFLVNVTRGIFERAGFAYANTLGKNNCIMRKVVGPIPLHRAPTPGERTTSDFG